MIDFWKWLEAFRYDPLDDLKQLLIQMHQQVEAIVSGKSKFWDNQFYWKLKKENSASQVPELEKMLADFPNYTPAIISNPSDPQEVKSVTLHNKEVLKNIEIVIKSLEYAEEEPSSAFGSDEEE